MIPPIDLPAVAMMKRQGGSFVQQLVILAIHADVINYAKIRKTWSNYFEEYNRTALREAERLGTLCLKCKGGMNCDCGIEPEHKTCAHYLGECGLAAIDEMFDGMEAKQ